MQFSFKYFPVKTPGVSAITKTNQMANRTLNFEEGNGNWWRPFNHERELLIGPEHWLHWHPSCSSVGKYGWKAVGNHAIWFFFLITYSRGNSWCPWYNRIKSCFPVSANFGFREIWVSNVHIVHREPKLFSFLCLTKYPKLHKGMRISLTEASYKKS